MRKLLLGNEPEIDQVQPRDRVLDILLVIAILLCMVAMCVGCDRVSAYTVDDLANAIYKAENSKNHPYGILKKYKRTTPRQACKNTVWHRWCIYRKSGLKTPFVAFLGAKYCPLGALNDPTGLNKNWVKNVTYFLKEGV